MFVLFPKLGCLWIQIEVFRSSEIFWYHETKTLIYINIFLEVQVCDLAESECLIWQVSREVDIEIPESFNIFPYDLTVVFLLLWGQWVSVSFLLEILVLSWNYSMRSIENYFVIINGCINVNFYLNNDANTSSKYVISLYSGTKTCCFKSSWVGLKTEQSQAPQVTILWICIYKLIIIVNIKRAKINWPFAGSHMDHCRSLF